MRKAIGAVAAMLVVAGAVAAPANAVAPASVETVASPVTVAVEADAMAVLSYDSPTVATIAAPEPEPVVVAPEPVVAPVVSVPAKTGGTVTEQPNQAVSTAPVAPAAVATEPEPAPVVDSAPAPAAPAATEPVPTPTASEGSEVQVTPEEVYSPEYLEGVSFQEDGWLYMGSYWGDTQPYINAGNRVIVSPTIRKADPNNPLGPTVDIFHVYASTAGAMTPEQIEAMGDPTK